MGCDLCKTAIVVPVSVISDERHLLTSADPTEEKDIPLQSIQSEDIHRILSSKSKEVTEQKETFGLSTLNQLATSNVYQEFNSDQSLSLLSQQDFRSTSSYSKDLITRPKTARTFVVESYLSESSENDFDNEAQTKSRGANFDYDDIVSSSASTNTEETLLYRYMISKFNNEQITIINDFDNDSDESYPIHQSIVTSTSSDSIVSSIQQKSNHKSLVTNMSEGNVERNIITNEISHQLYEIDSSIEVHSNLSSDSEDRAMNALKSPNLMKSDNNQKPIVYETSYESEIDLEH